MNYIAVFVGGVLGGLIRYLLTLVIPTPSGFPLDILIINLSGCLALGAFYAIADARNIKSWMRTGIATGVIGAYTTFSSFCAGVVGMQNHQVLLGFVYVFISMVMGPLLAYIGEVCATFVTARIANEFEEKTV